MPFGTKSKKSSESVSPSPLDRLWPRGEVLSQQEAWGVMAAMHPDRCDPHDPAATAELVLLEYAHYGLVRRAPDFAGAWTRPLVDGEVPAPPKVVEDTEPLGGMWTTFGERKSRLVHIVTEEGERLPLRVWFDVPPYTGSREGYAAHLQAAHDASLNPTSPVILD